MIEQQPQEHYLHYQQFPHAARTHIKSFGFFDGVRHCNRVVIVNHNAIEIYEVKGNSVVYVETH